MCANFGFGALGEAAISGVVPTGPGRCLERRCRRVRSAPARAGTAWRRLALRLAHPLARRAHDPTVRRSWVDRPAPALGPRPLRLVRAARLAPDHGRPRTSPAPPPAHRSVGGYGG